MINHSDAPIEFDSVSYEEANRFIDIASQAYEFQNRSVADDNYVGPFDDVKKVENAQKNHVRFNRRTIITLRNMTDEDLRRARSRGEESLIDENHGEDARKR